MPLIFLSPRYWSTWLGLFMLWLIAKLPWKLQINQIIEAQIWDFPEQYLVVKIVTVK